MYLAAIPGVALAQSSPHSKQAAQTKGNSSKTEEAEQVEVENVKKQYWAVGDETRLGVVQDRYYSKAERLQLGVFAGIYSGDPFFDTKSFGGIIGYHFTEYLAIKALGWKDNINNSSALNKFVSVAGVGTNSNRTRSFVGAEGVISPLYGKLSLFGKLILYFDLHLSLGVGSTDTDNGRYISPFMGIGQEVFVAKSASISIDARWLTYKEDIVERIKAGPTFGQKIDEQTVYNNLAALGFNYYF